MKTMQQWHKLGFVFCILLLGSCNTELLPKPKAMLRLSYTEPTYQQWDSECAYRFEKSTEAKFKKVGNTQQCWYNLEYPKLRAAIYISYYSIQNNLDSLLIDAQNLTQEHVVKADEIIQEPYSNPEAKVYGMFYAVSGNAASQAQFYVTDSTRHFVSGSVYFKVRPNYDSILPAAQYLQNDVRHLMETIRWKE